jgi:FdhD protein
LPKTVKVRSLQLVTGGLTSSKRIEEYVALDAPLAISVNGEHFVTLFATPSQEKQLTLGHLIGEGVINAVEEVSGIDIREGEVNVSVSTDISERLRTAETFRIATTACGSADDFYRLLDRLDTPLVRSEYQTTPEQITLMVAELNRRSTRNRMEIAVHAVALFTGGDLVAYAEDVGRNRSRETG